MLGFGKLVSSSTESLITQGSTENIATLGTDQRTYRIPKSEFSFSSLAKLSQDRNSMDVEIKLLSKDGKSSAELKDFKCKVHTLDIDTVNKTFIDAFKQSKKSDLNHGLEFGNSSFFVGKDQEQNQRLDLKNEAIKFWAETRYDILQATLKDVCL